METTKVVTSGRGSNPKNTLYVGGLDDDVKDKNLFEAFIPFGDIRDVTIPLDFTSGKHRGFGFVEFEEVDDAAAAIANMHNAEFFGKVLKVNYAQPMGMKGVKGWAKQAVWADADKYFEDLHRQKEQPEPKEPQTQKPAATNPMEDLERSMDDKAT